MLKSNPIPIHLPVDGLVNLNPRVDTVVYHHYLELAS